NTLQNATEAEKPTIREVAGKEVSSFIQEIQKLPASTSPAVKAQYLGAMLSIHAAIVKPTSNITKTHFDAELEINDYPQQARWKVTHKDALAHLTEFTGTAITTRGSYIPPGAKVPPGERKLYLYIEGPTEHAVQLAKREIKKVLEETAASAPPELLRQMGRYSITF